MIMVKENQYLILIKEVFVRDSQIAKNDYIQNHSKGKEINSTDYDWDDFEGDINLGIFYNKSLKSAINEAAKVCKIDEFALIGYELK